ncbi:glucose-1-phosphate thymidylyltransferase [Pedobacter frigiditerrae]|uniref:Glucose-1-phosphate thymidylyltransferase n=1 Tax=Pedobacter frigiditerrae TaxID=2530452 RepID=A0A4V2MI57_9SPHI|nr:putative sugar nucleotidyl transferase [Pedobacter frigiditerrae]TCC89106.1 glucose-1-phosphate thymidylyltransferase [Pedobacter frigiditerrae]
MAINLFDDKSWRSLRPLTFTRPVADLRVGILTIAEKWAKHLNADFGFQTQDYLSSKFTAKQADLFINGAVCPNEALIDTVLGLKPGQGLYAGNLCLAIKLEQPTVELNVESVVVETLSFDYPFTHIQFPEDIFRSNDLEIREDFKLLTKDKTSATLSSTNVFLGDNIFVEEGATAECSTFNSLQGPIYLGKNSQVWEGCFIRGSFALCEGSSVKMGAKIYPQTTIGPFSRVGGEINNAVIWGYSSKGHEGYLGNSVMGQWCNIGADTNNSNLKNNYAEVKLWDYEQESFRKTGLQFCGLIMADHAKCGINTMFNTGTVAGVSANVFGAGFPRNFIPDFAWGGAHGFEVYTLNKMLETAKLVYNRRGMELDDVEIAIITEVFERTKALRHF